MAQSQMIEGTTEEITRQLQQSYAGQRLRVFIEPESEENVSMTVFASPFAVRSREHLLELLREGIESGPATPVTDADWDDIRREVRARAAHRNGVPLSNA